jgi:hypothetical protein
LEVKGLEEIVTRPEVGIRFVLDGYDEFEEKCQRIIDLIDGVNLALGTLCSTIEQLKNVISGFRKD